MMSVPAEVGRERRGTSPRTSRGREVQGGQKIVPDVSKKRKDQGHLGCGRAMHQLCRRLHLAAFVRSLSIAADKRWGDKCTFNLLTENIVNQLEISSIKQDLALRVGRNERRDGEVSYRWYLPDCTRR